jgi:hypothetical protein
MAVRVVDIVGESRRGCAEDGQAHCPGDHSGDDLLLDVDFFRCWFRRGSWGFGQYLGLGALARPAACCFLVANLGVAGNPFFDAVLAFVKDGSCFLLAMISSSPGVVDVTDDLGVV